jgi:hypothetical protein
MDVYDDRAERDSLASDAQATPIREDVVDAVQEELERERAEEERARRVLRRRDMLQQEIEIAAMEQQLDVLRRQRYAGHTPGVTPGQDEDSRAGSVAGSIAGSTHAPHRGHASRPRLREPDTFKGKTLKEARDFIRSLELVFALAPDAYSIERERILYGVMFLAGEPRETWHQNHSVSELDGYLWDDFKSFVLDAVEDPVNRSLSTTVAYEMARQGEGQTAQAFATELATLEEQMDPYTPAQRTRHLLAKLKRELRTAIITYHEVPKRREDLVSLATRLESAGRRSEIHTVLGSTKRHASEAHQDRTKKRRASPSRTMAPRPVTSQAKDRRDVRASRAPNTLQCYGCKEYGHIRSECPNRDKWSAEDRAVRKVGASVSKAESANKASDKPKP